MKITRIPFIFEFLLCAGLLLLFRITSFWQYLIYVSFGVTHYNITLDLIGIFLHFFVFCIVIFTGLKIQKRTLGSVCVFKKAGARIWLAMFVCSIGFVLFSFYISILFDSFKWGWNTDYTPREGNLFLLVINSAVIPAVCEEILIKGLVFSSLKKDIPL